MGYFKNHKATIVAALALVLLYFLFRVPLLNSLPIFTDEAIYLRWAQIASHDPSWTFISLTDGKQPLFIWASMLAMRFIEDPLMAGRAVSIVTGFFSMAGLILLSYELFRRKSIALLTALVYIVSPFSQVYDRMALMDSMSAMFYIFAIYLSVLLAKKVRLDLAFALGFAIGGGLLTKSSAIFSIYILPFTLILFNFKKVNVWQTLLKWGLFALFAALIGELFYSFLRLSPIFGMIAQKNQVFVYPLSQWINHPFTYFLGNFKGLSIWFSEYLTYSFIILIFISLALISRQTREKLLLLLYFVIPFLSLSLFAKVIYPRYILFMTLSLFPLVAWGLYYLIMLVKQEFEKRKINKNISLTAALILILLFLTYPAFVSIQFAADPSSAKIAGADRGQYISGWPSGWGVREAVTFFEKESGDKKIFVATQGTFGILPQALDIYLYKNKNIVIKAYWPIKDEMPTEVLSASKIMPTYFVFYEPCSSCNGTGVPPSGWILKRVLTVKKGEGINFGVYKVE